MKTSAEYWDDVASSSWGRYICAAEAKVIDAAQGAAPPPRKALDVGCGGGRWSRLILDQGWSVTGLDIDAEVIRLYGVRNTDARPVLVGHDNAELPADDSSVSLVLCIEVFAVAHSSWFLGEARRVLVPRGRLVSVVWNLSSLRGRFSDTLSRVRHKRRHTHYRESYRSWRRRLIEAGFDVEAEYGLCWFPFGRASNSRFVPACVAFERTLRLSRLPALSPWVLVTASRRPDGDHAGCSTD